MTVTGVLIIVGGVAAVLFAGGMAGAMRDRARVPFEPAPVVTVVRHHAMPLRAEVADWLRALAVEALSNFATVTRGIA